MYGIKTRLLLGLGTVLLWIRSAECFQPATAISLRSRGASPLRRAGASELRVSHEDRERDLKFERELDRDAELWVNGDPGKQKLWDKAKTWRRVNQREYSHGNILRTHVNSSQFTAVQIVAIHQGVYADDAVLDDNMMRFCWIV